ncbi:MAG: hypothetical protein GX053_12635 [Tissierella sp.]|nr:hypothetical protein [Tissierella sp.]
MRITERDRKVLDFIENFKIATTDTIQELFYPSLKVAQRRLKLLHDNKYIKRDREHFTSQFYYYIRKPKQLKHSLLLTDFYRELNKTSSIELFKNEFIIEDLRSDGFVAYELKGKKDIAFVEVEISNKGFDIEKYERLYKSMKWRKLFPKFPTIIAITDKPLPSTRLKVIQVNEDMSNLKEVF